MNKRNICFSDSEIMDLAVKHGLGQKYKPASTNGVQFFHADGGYRTDELLEFSKELIKTSRDIERREREEEEPESTKHVWVVIIFLMLMLVAFALDNSN